MIKEIVKKHWHTSDNRNEEAAIEYVSQSIMALPKEIHVNILQEDEDYAALLRAALAGLCGSWSRYFKPMEVEELCEIFYSHLPKITDTPPLCIPNPSLAAFDEHPVAMTMEMKQQSLVPTPEELLPPITSSASSSGSTASTDKDNQPAVSSQRAKRAERKRTSIHKPSAASSPIDIDALLEEPKDGRGKDINLPAFDLCIKGRVILQDATLIIPYRRRIGLVGRNGVGKSTLLKAIATRELPVPRSIRIIHVEQEVIGDDTPAIESVMAGDFLLQALWEREKMLQNTLLTSAEDDEAGRHAALAELAKIHARLVAIDADGAEARASGILTGLGFSSKDFRRPCRQFSGGWRMRLALAQALFAAPDLLLLDEPTNMLDLPAVAWLASFLTNHWKSSLMIVSHDRDFLDYVTEDTIHLHHGSLDFYRGSTYSSFVIARRERMVHHERERQANIAYRQSLQAFVDRWRYQASRASLAQSKLKILERLPIIAPWPEDPPVRFTFEAAQDRPPEPWVSLADVEVGYDGRTENKPGAFKLQCASFSIHQNSRIALVGPNGAGKSTFLKLLTEQAEVKTMAGSITKQGRIRIAYFAQHHMDALDMSLSALQALSSFFADPGRASDQEEIRRHLGSFGLTGALALQPIGTLSGGQRSRVIFAALSLRRPHILILDEPTNHLDIDAIDALVCALNKFTGGVLMVSHDVKFIEAVASQLWVCEGGSVHRFPGDSIRAYVASLTKKCK